MLPSEEILQQRIAREQQEAEKAAQRDKELEEEASRLEKEIEEEIRGIAIDHVQSSETDFV